MFTYNYTDHKKFDEKVTGPTHSAILTESDSVDFKWNEAVADNAPQNITNKRPYYSQPGPGYKTTGVPGNSSALSGDWTTRNVGYIGNTSNSSGKNFVTSSYIFAGARYPNAAPPYSTDYATMFDILGQITCVVIPVTMSNAPGPSSIY